MIRVLRLLLPLLLAAVATVSVALPAEAATFSASRTTVISGESVRFSGTLGRQPARKVLLQRKSGTRWVTVTSTTSRSTGAYAFTVRPTGTVGSMKTYRATAPRVGARRAVTTTTRTIRFVAQTAALSAPATVTTGQQLTAVATFRPIRTGRVAVLQRLVGGAWSEVARGRQDSLGRTTFRPTLVATGATPLRSLALASGGAPAKASAPRNLTVLPPALQRMSQSVAGLGGDGPSYFASLSGDGRLVAFTSDATDLVPGDTNGISDVFVRDQLTGAIERISVTSDEAQGAQGGENPSMSADGRYVAFESSSQLTSDPQSSTKNIFVRDLVAGTTTKATVPKSGDLLTNNNSYHPSLSADGRYLAFVSLATNVVPGDTNAKADVFLRDLVAGTTVRVSTDNDGNQSDNASTFPEVSADGSYVVYASTATNLVTDDTNGKSDVFRWGRSNTEVIRVSQTTEGVQVDADAYGATLSADGRYVAFHTNADTLLPAEGDGAADVYVWDATNWSIVRASATATGQQFGQDALGATFSADGGHLSFVTYAPLTPEDTNGLEDLYVRDLLTGTYQLASSGHHGTIGNGSTTSGMISADGSAVVFTSLATNLVPAEDRNTGNDVFHRDLTR